MDVGALASALIDARVGQLQLALAAKMLRGSAESADQAAKLIDAAQENISRLANVAAGIGQSLDVSA